MEPLEFKASKKKTVVLINDSPNMLSFNSASDRVNMEQFQLIAKLA